jgi:hypothetical protein
VTVSASGGTTAYSGTGTFSRSAGTYSYTVTDHNGCTSTTTGNITQPSTLSCEIVGNSGGQVLAGSTGDQLSVNVTGGTQPYKTYAWTVTSDNSGTWKITDPTLQTITFNAPAIPSTATFKVTVTDANGCTTSCQGTVTATPQSFVTDSMLCTFTSPFRLIFTQDTQNMPCYKLTASNPGQYYYNMSYWIDPAKLKPGDQVTFSITLPYPFVTQGAQPIHAYDGVDTVANGSQTCLVPGNPIFVSSDQVTLDKYVNPTPGLPPQVGVTTYTFTETVTIPASGFVYLNIHLDYGLKKQTGFAKGGVSGNDAIPGTCTLPTTVTVLDGQSYTFGYAATDGTQVSDNQSVTSANAFKKNPGVGGCVSDCTTLNEVAGAIATLLDPTGKVLATSAATDVDGWYVLSYKWTGKSANLTVTITPAGAAKPSQTATITLKANGYVEQDFALPPCPK